MLRRLTARWRLWKVALVGKDDPEGEYLLKMGGRVRLAGEVEVEPLRRYLAADMLAAVMSTSAPEV